MPSYRSQVGNLQEDLEKFITQDITTGIKVTKVTIAGSWKKGTILRPTGDNPIDIDLVLYIEGGIGLQDDLERLHDLMVTYLEKIYPTKDIRRDVDASGKTRSIKIKFTGSGLEVDIVPVIPIKDPKEYVWQPQRGGGGKYVTSVTGQLAFAATRREKNNNYTAIVRSLKWWRNYKEMDDLSSFTIELIISYLEINKGIESGIEEGIIRFFKFVSDPSFPTINFINAINKVPVPTSNFFVADPTNNENNAAKKLNDSNWQEIKKEANEAFEALNIAQSKVFEGETVDEWKFIFGPSFNIKNAE